ncbi:MAG: phage head-tail connector protein [Polaromonas sp.]
MYKIITPAATEPISINEAKLHLREDTADAGNDALISAYITSAREYAEHYTGRALMPQTLEMALHCFPGTLEPICLDMPPVTSLTSIKYTDLNGVEQTIAPSAYALSLYGNSEKVAPTYGNYWPFTQIIPNAVRIRYVTGYITTTLSVKAAILLHVQLQYDSLTPSQRDALEKARDSLLNTIKVWGR